MDIKKSAFLLVVMSGLATAQRGSYAGKKPIGYPMLTTTTTVAPLADRFGEDNGITSTTSRLPPEALGDRELVDRISKLPQDKQPFWYLNWQALEANRNNPQSYEPNPNSFVDQFVGMQGKSAAGVSPVSVNSRGSDTSQQRLVDSARSSDRLSPTGTNAYQVFNEHTSRNTQREGNVRENRKFNSARNWQRNPINGRDRKSFVDY